MTWVLDASAALAWVFPRADPAEAELSRALLRGMTERDVFVPEIWHLEVLNALVTGQRRGVIAAAKVDAFLARLDALPIRTWEISYSHRKPALFALAARHGLSAYDAAYLDLAFQLGAALPTFDRKLAAARDAAGVPAI
jgi:predicted nucleic acid-binding protein